MNSDQVSNLKVYQIRKKGPGQQKGYGTKEINPNDSDEEQMINKLKAKSDLRAKMAEDLRKRQGKLLDLNEQIRKYDLKGTTEDELDKLRAQALDLDKSWREMNTSLEEKLKFCEKIHRKH